MINIINSNNIKNRCLIFVGCLVYLLCACEPNFNLNAPYKDVPVVYGVLNYQDSIHYVKIYKGYQTNKNGNAFIDAQNPDSIYYYNDIKVVLQEYNGENRTSRPEILLKITYDFPRDSGIFYYGNERIVYYTTESLNKDRIYKIQITNLINGNVVEGKTPIVGDFGIITVSPTINMLGKSASIPFGKAANAADYELHVNFLYFEVDIKTNQVIKIDKIKKNICPKVGGNFKQSTSNEYQLYKEFTPTFYDDIAAQLKPNEGIVRYSGTPTSRACIEIEGWAAEESIVNFLISNRPVSGFVQVKNDYTNLTASDGVAFGFFSSRYKCRNTVFNITKNSEDTLYYGPKTHHLGFRPWIEYKP